MSFFLYETIKPPDGISGQLAPELVQGQKEINNNVNLYYDTLFIQSLRDMDLFRSLAWVYRSNWRVLHIDGFEGGRKLPVGIGKLRTFFDYAPDPITSTTEIGGGYVGAEITREAL
jgi:hypothetical protein